MEYGEDPELDALLAEAGVEDDPDTEGETFFIPEGDTSLARCKLRYGSIRAPRGYSVSLEARRGNFSVSKMPRKRGTALFWFRHTIPE